MSVDGKLRAHFDALNGGRVGTIARPPRIPLSKTYCILMTPRSGSTWLTRRIARIDVLSYPDEYFNTALFADTLKYNPGRDVYEVFDVIAEKNHTEDGLFGLEISYFDLEELELEARLLDLMVGEKFFFFLNRQNFVAQAISLYTAVESNFFHSFEAQDSRRASPATPYDDDKIMFWTCHILQQEFGFQQWMKTNNVRAMRLRYEELCDHIDAVIARMAAYMRVDLHDHQALATPQTERITAGHARDYERRFRNAHPEFCRKWEAVRGTQPCPYSGAAPAYQG